MTGVQTLAGYVQSKTRGRLAFAILVDNDHGAGAATRALMDQVVGLLAE
jgi:D-alanyl-D-alanine carboxypeptidase